jgi:hypothetical protein
MRSVALQPRHRAALSRDSLLARRARRIIGAALRLHRSIITIRTRPQATRPLYNAKRAKCLE